MRFSVGCLTGIIVGILIAVAGYFGYIFLFSGDNLPLLPATAAGDPDLTITVSEAYLNSQMQQGLAAQGLNLGDLAVKLHAPNTADATMSLNLRVLGQPITVHPNATMHFGVSNGTITLTLDQVNVSGFNVPQNVINQQLGDFQHIAQNELNAEAKRMLANTGLHIIGVESTESALIIKLAR